MKTINAEYTYVIDGDNINYLSAGSSVITNSDTLKVNNFSTQEVDNCLNHAAENDIEDDVIILESEPRSAASDEAVSKLIDAGKLIITNQ